MLHIYCIYYYLFIYCAVFAAGKKDKTDTGFQEKNGIRCVRLNPSGTHVASGDRAGNVR